MISTELQLGKAGEHLVCADLILQGYNAFLADQGLPYDVLIDHRGNIFRLQVKATKTLTEIRKGFPPVYRFQIKQGKHQSKKRTPIFPAMADCFAFVILTKRKVAYIPMSSLLGKKGAVLQTLDLRSRDILYHKPSCGRYFEDYLSFSPLNEGLDKSKG